MAQDTRIVRIDADENLGQFLEQTIESCIGREDTNVSVSEIDPNIVSEDLLE